MNNFWQQLEAKKLTDKNQVEEYLIKKLGSPVNPIQQNLLTEILKKINSYYFSEPVPNTTAYSLIGTVFEIIEKHFKEGKNKGQNYYVLNLGEDKLQALQENLEPSKWSQIEKLAILNQNLVFKYKKWITNKQLLDFYLYQKPHEKN